MNSEVKSNFFEKKGLPLLIMIKRASFTRTAQEIKSELKKIKKVT